VRRWVPSRALCRRGREHASARPRRTSAPRGWRAPSCPRPRWQRARPRSFPCPARSSSRSTRISTATTAPGPDTAMNPLNSAIPAGSLTHLGVRQREAARGRGRPLLLYVASGGHGRRELRPDRSTTHPGRPLDHPRQAHARPRAGLPRRGAGVPGRGARARVATRPTRTGSRAPGCEPRERRDAGACPRTGEPGTPFP
jgi:hypothetical protein